MSKASNLAKFAPNILPGNNLSVGVITATAINAVNITGSSQIGISSASNYLGLGTQFNFVGQSVTVDYNSSSGISTVTISSSSVSKAKIYYFANS